MSNPRDTQFAGFASRLLQEMLDQGAYVAIADWVTGGDRARTEQLIARRAYDLVTHAINSIGPYHLDVLSTKETVEDVPDMAEFPKNET